MKVRQGFVTNSSSSSFIISSKRSLTEKIKAIVEIDIDELASTKITTLKELKEYTEYNYDYNPDDPTSDDYYQDNYNKMKAKIESGEVIYIGYASNESDNAIEQLIYHSGFNGITLPEGVELIMEDC